MLTIVTSSAVMNAATQVSTRVALRVADIAIRHGLGDYAGLTSERLLQPRLVPVAWLYKTMAGDCRLQRVDHGGSGEER